MAQEKELKELKISCIQTLKSLSNMLDDNLDERDFNYVLESIKQSIGNIKKIQEWLK